MAYDMEYDMEYDTVLNMIRNMMEYDGICWYGLLWYYINDLDRFSVVMNHDGGGYDHEIIMILCGRILMDY